MADDDIPQIELWLRSRDESAARWIVERYHPRVVQIAWRHLAPGQSVEDIAQEVFVKIFASLDHFDTARPFENWIGWRTGAFVQSTVSHSMVLARASPSPLRKSPCCALFSQRRTRS